MKKSEQIKSVLWLFTSPGHWIIIYKSIEFYQQNFKTQDLLSRVKGEIIFPVSINQYKIKRKQLLIRNLNVLIRNGFSVGKVF